MAHRFQDPDDPAPVTVAYGGGVNSTAMIVCMVERDLPIDLILFADTGGERPDTYAYVETFSNWLEDQGYPAIQTVRKVTQDGEEETLEEQCLRTGTLPSLAYGYKKCSQKFKIAPQDKFINNWTPAQESWEDDVRVVKLIGFDVDEYWRNRPEDDDKYFYEYPLIEWQWGRHDCKEAIERAGLCVPGKSSCFFCPAMKTGEITQLREQYPDLMERALDIEENAQENLDSIEGLARNAKWASILKKHDQQPDLFPDDMQMVFGDCLCFE